MRNCVMITAISSWKSIDKYKKNKKNIYAKGKETLLRRQNRAVATNEKKRLSCYELIDLDTVLQSSRWDILTALFCFTFYFITMLLTKGSNTDKVIK